jgi:hypothetical protein
VLFHSLDLIVGIESMGPKPMHLYRDLLPIRHLPYGCPDARNSNLENIPASSQAVAPQQSSTAEVAPPMLAPQEEAACLAAGRTAKARTACKVDVPHQVFLAFL